MRKAQILIWLKLISLVVLSTSLILGFIINIKDTTDRQNQPLTFTSPPEKNKIFKSYAYITGEIIKPGIYEIPENFTIENLINLAGGYTENADKLLFEKSINLANIVKDQDRFNIKSRILGTSSTSSTFINLNTATLEELDSLPGIGSVTAQKIIDARPFSKIEDLLSISGIGESKFAQIKDLVIVNE